MGTRVSLVLIAILAGGAPAAAAPKCVPSRPPVKGCAWEKFSDARVGLEAWVQRCDFGFRKIVFLAVGRSLAIRYSDGGGAPDPLVDVFDLLPDETPEDGVKRLTFVPDPAYQKELDAKADPNEVGDPRCGDWGTAPDGIQYFEVHPASKSRKFLFVRVGQDEPLFDEQNFRLLPAR
jgi:hypothetical protein